jgi:hypothetical protein
MIAEVLIYVPSIANFRYSWLNDRIFRRCTAALVFRQRRAPDREDALGIPDALAKQILDSIARAVPMKMGQRRPARRRMPLAIDQDIDMRHALAAPSSTPSTRCLDRQRRHARGRPSAHGRRFIEIIVDESPCGRRCDLLGQHPGHLAAHIGITATSFI